MKRTPSAVITGAVLSGQISPLRNVKDNLFKRSSALVSAAESISLSSFSSMLMINLPHIKSAFNNDFP
jgi:hypothetical protein